MAQKKGGPDDIMAAAEMKPILALARHGDPVSCTIGLTKDKDGVILLDKKRKPKALVAEIKKKAAAAGLELDMTSLRFGHATVDPADTTLLTFTVNKAAPGAMRPKVLEHVKKAGFGKIEIVVDEGLEDEVEAVDQAAPAATPGATAQPSADATAAGEPSPAPAEDAAAMTRTLTDLVRRMIPAIAADPTRGDALKGLVGQAQAGLRGGDLTAAGQSIETLRQALDAAGGTTPAAANTAAINTTAFAKARLAWVAARQKVEGELDKLHAEMTSVYKDHGFGADLDRVFRAKVEPMLGSLDTSLAEKLDEVTKNTDPAQHARLVQQARQIIQSYESYIVSEPLIAKLDDNPFVPLQIEKTLTATLSTLSKVIA